MAGPRRELTADDVRELLAELGRRLQAKGVAATVYVVGGAAIALELDARRVTADVDAVFHPETRATEARRWGHRRHFRCRDDHGDAGDSHDDRFVDQGFRGSDSGNLRLPVKGRRSWAATREPGRHRGVRRQHHGAHHGRWGGRPTPCGRPFLSAVTQLSRSAERQLRTPVATVMVNAVDGSEQTYAVTLL